MCCFFTLTATLLSGDLFNLAGPLHVGAQLCALALTLSLSTRQTSANPVLDLLPYRVGHNGLPLRSNLQKQVFYGSEAFCMLDTSETDSGNPDRHTTARPIILILPPPAHGARRTNQVKRSRH